MTGFGEAHYQTDGLSVSVEVRTINSRYLKFSIRTSEGYGSLEPLVEAEVRKRVRRGTIQVMVRIDRAPSPEDYRIDARVLDSYRQQLEEMQKRWGNAEPVPLAHLLTLPGVVSEDAYRKLDVRDDWPVIQRALNEAMVNLDRMRAEEGRAMAKELAGSCRAAAASLSEIESRAPHVVDAYRQRLQERMEKILVEFNVTLDPADLIKEVGLFADRTDITEEIVRFRSHLEQFEANMQSAESSGRKLEFLTQEMVREGNTIGSKASDVESSKHVIEIKAALERIREMIQNIE
jgi:uncharacterized protein (TIGR00255 family)